MTATIIAKMSEVCRQITTNETEFLRVYEELLYIACKNEGIPSDVRLQITDVLEGINEKQNKLLRGKILNDIHIKSMYVPKGLRNGNS